MTVWSENAARFASRPEDVAEVIDTIRETGVRSTLDHLHEGHPDAALDSLTLSVVCQAQVAGLRLHGLGGAA